MKKFTKLTLLTGMVLLAGLSLTACDNKDKSATATSTTQTTQQAPAQNAAPATPAAPVDNSTYVGQFDATQSRMRAYLDSKYDFNSSLPLRGNFLALLNGISNAQFSAAQKKLTGARNDLFVLETLQSLNTQFNNIIAGYKKDPAASEKALNKLGVNVDFDHASFTTLVNQLNKGCVANQNYQIDISKIKSGLIIKQDGKVIPFPDAETQKLNDWNRNMVNVCTLTNEFYTVVNAPKFSYDTLPDTITALQNKISEAK